jgi:serine/threonine-protein kinase
LVKLVDFGTAEPSENPAASVREPTGTPTDMGSPQFVAPEQLRAERAADARSDIWALGATLFTLLAGRSPFERPYLSETYLAILSGRVPDLSAMRPGIERPLAAAVERCLAADPEQRFASAAELYAALAPFAATRARRASPARAERARPGRISRSKSSFDQTAESSLR